jgi:UDP-glucose 4-epimerase
VTTDAPLIALTGGSGFVGRRVGEALRGRGYRIRHLARRAPAGADEWQSFDLGAPDGVSLAGCSALIHLAAHIPTDHGALWEAERCVRLNALGTLHLVDAAVRAGVGHILQTGSANAYAPCSDPPREDAPLFPASRGYYLGSKILQEIHATQRCRDGDARLQTLRLASVYGPGQAIGAPAAMVRAAMAGGPIKARGSFGADFVHVDDVVQALLILLEGDAPSGAFNVASGVRTTIAQLARTLSALTGAPVEDEAGATDDQGFSALNIDRMLALGYRPTPLKDGLPSLLRP